MALFSRKVDYALLVLSYLHHRPEGGTARQIADRFDLSKAFCANVLKGLASRGLVRGQRGQGGGYVLARPSDRVCLCDLLEALGEPFHLAECNRTVGEGEEQACARESTCPVRGAIHEVHRRILDLLRTVTLADLFASTGEAGPGCTQYGLEVLLRKPEVLA